MRHPELLGRIVAEKPHILSKEHLCEKSQHAVFLSSERGGFLFTGSYMTLSLVGAVLLKNKEFVFYYVVMCLLIAALLFGAANEVVEFIATLTLPGTYVGGYANTGWDLVANLTGCLISATAIHVANTLAGGDVSG